MTNKLHPILILYLLLLTACGPTGPTFDPAKYGTVERDVTYCTMDELPQKMDIYYPSSGGPWPALVYVHGGGWIEGDKADGEGWGKVFNDSGFLVISVNYRLGDYQTKFPAMIEDVKCAVRHIRAHSTAYNIKSDHIGALGISAGGHLVALLGTADLAAGWEAGEYLDQSSQVQAVVVMSGIADFTSNIPGGLNGAIYYAFGELGGKNTPENVSFSPVSYATPDDPPFLIFHGNRDGVVPVEQAKILHAKLTEAGVPSTLVIVEGGDHGLRKPSGEDAAPTGAEITRLMLDFLKENLE